VNKKRKSKLRKWIVTGVVIVAAIGAAGYFLLKPSKTAYESVTAKKGDITTYYSFSGNIDTKNRQTVMSEKVLQISEIKVKEGDVVNKGDVLIKTSAGDEIKAKISGEVANLNVEEDQQIMSGTKLMDIVDYDNLKINFKVDEYDLAAVQTDKEATVKISALNKEITGKISSISKEGTVSNGVTYFTATIDFAKDDTLRLGMSAEVKVLNSKASGAVTLPMTAVQFDDNNNPYVLKQGAENTAVRTEITTGINDGVNVEIKSGVSNEETILYTKAKSAATTGLMGGRASSQSQSSGGGSN